MITLAMRNRCATLNLTMNPFMKYSLANRSRAISLGIIREVVAETGMTTPKVSRTFAGLVKRPDPRLVTALNNWLAKNSLPIADANGKPVRAVIEKLRKEK